MAFTQAQLDRISDYMLPTHLRKAPIDQITTAMPFYNWLMKNKEEWSGAGGYLTEPLRMKRNGNGQDYFGADQVTYNARDPLSRTNWRYYNYHQGFGFDEDTLTAAGIRISDDGEAVSTRDERDRLANLYQEAIDDMRISSQEDLDERFHLNGAQSSKAAPGLDYLVSLTPTVGVVGGLDAAQFEAWRNNSFPDIDVATPADGNINAAMDQAQVANQLYGRVPTDAIFAGRAFIEHLQRENRAIHHVNVNTTGTAGTSFDGGIKQTSFNGIVVQHDPSFEKLDLEYGPLATPWTNRCYMLASRSMRLRPLAGEWFRKRNGGRMPDRYVYYRAMTSKYGLTVGQRNANAVLSIDV